MDGWFQTSIKLTESQIEVLRSGLNFALALNKAPTRDFIAAVEVVEEKLRNNLEENLRMKICGVIRKAKPPTSVQQVKTPEDCIEGIETDE